MLAKNTMLGHRRVALVGCAVVALTTTGCRSSMPRMNMFGFKSQPSPEALAGTGPTTTYPMPPSATATPEAIASVAGGTAAREPDAKIAGLDIDAGTPSRSGYVDAMAAASKSTAPNMPGTPNMSAAQANGFLGATPPTRPSSSFAGGPTTPPSGPAGSTGGMSGMKGPSSDLMGLGGIDMGGKPNSLAGLGAPTPGNSATKPSAPAFNLPSMGSTNTPTVDMTAAAGPPPPASSTAANAAALPQDIAGMAGLTIPTDPPTISLPDSPVATTGSLPSVASGPSATVASSYSLPETGNNRASSIAPVTNSTPGTYAPGSTSVSPGYPTQGYAPSGTAGSIYR